MARGLNKTLLIGNLGSDPINRSGVVALSVATTDTWKDKNTGELKERTEWHNVKVFGKLAEQADKYLKKGSKIYVEGSNRTDKYTDKDGVEKYSTEVIARDIQFLSGGGNGNSQGGSGGGNTGGGAQEVPDFGDDSNTPF